MIQFFRGEPEPLPRIICTCEVADNPIAPDHSDRNIISYMVTQPCHDR